MDLNEWAAEAHKNSALHGFWDDIPYPQDNTDADSYRATYYGNKLMLIVGEVSEAHEELRKNTDPTYTYFREDGKPEGLPFELADIVIRVFDLAAHLDLDLDGLVGAKMNYNAKRPHKHSKNF